MTKRIVLAFAALVALAGLTDRATGCSCGAQPLADAYRGADAVFTGQVTEITSEPLGSVTVGDQQYPRTLVWAKFAIDERFKGVDSATVLVSPGEEGSTCSARLVVGERYLVFAHRSSDDKRLSTSNCDPTGTLQDQAAALVYCRRVARDGKEPRVIGTLTDASPSPNQPMQTEERPVAGVTVTLQAGGETYHSVTDRDGVFYIDDVPDGTYTVRFQLPEEYRILNFSAYGGDDPSERANTVRVSGAVCVVREQVTRSGAITGRFLDSIGKPLADLPLCLVPRDRLESLNPSAIVAFATTEADGTFRIEPLPPGEYALLVNWPPMPKIDRVPMPDFICADKADPAHAAVLVITPGKQIALGELKAPPTPKHIEVDVTVVDDQGKPMQAMLTCQVEGGRPVGFVWTDEEKGTVRIFLPSGKRYTLQAKVFAGEGTVDPDPVIIDPDKPPTNLKIVVTRTSTP